jgi:hypothetical protein
MSPAPALPESLDLAHHLTKRIRAAQPSAMKAMGKMLMEKKLLSLAGGESKSGSDCLSNERCPR